MNNELLQFALTAFGLLFVMINPIAVSPVFVAVTSGMDARQRKATLTRAVIAAFLVALFFLYVGRAFLSYMGVSVEAFSISGGILLFAIAFSMLMGQRSPIQLPLSSQADRDVAIFPLTIPQLAGPGTIATILLLATQAGADWTRIGVLTGVLAFIYLIAWPIMFMAERVMNRLGDGPMHIITRILGLVLAALAVQFILNGIAAFYHGLMG
ncbi:MAG: MarC family protein [Anaerolineales bacterium]|nr:MarC family protein [Anaerolineales bacterium]